MRKLENYNQVLTQLKRQSLLSDDERLALADKINMLNKQSYEEFSPRYANHHPILSGPQIDHLDKIYNYIAKTFQSRPLKILDVGCGQGLSLEYLNNFDGTECLGVESSKEFRKLISRDIRCIDGDMLALKLESNAYQAILHHSTLHHLPWFTESHLGMCKALNEAVRVLAPYGILSIVIKYQEEAFFDEIGRFFSPMNEKIMRELLEKEDVHIQEVTTIHIPKARKGWQDWIRVQATKKGGISISD